MTSSRNRRARAILMAACAALVVVPATAYAQERVSFSIPAQELGTALTELARQSNREIYFSADLTRGKRAPRLSGRMSFEQALDRLLGGSGLRRRVNANGSIVIESATQKGNASAAATDTQSGDGSDRGATPEIVVVGQRDWTLNTGIARTQDDSQPWQVFSAQDIQRSGARDLDAFLRNSLNANSSVALPEQLPTQEGVHTNVNLRGLGSDETLILVDGRRLPGVNLGTGTVEQPNISGIALSSIERIEVLPSSAGGIYGGGATGGVINIILKRNYRGIELTGSYGNVFDGSAANRRLEAAGGLNLENGRTNITFSGSWSKSDPLLQHDRNFLARGRARLAVTAPELLAGAVGTTPNIDSATGETLTFKPEYGGGSLGSSFLSIPSGYRGVLLDGIAPLIANAGIRNLDVPDAVPGGRESLIGASELWTGRLALRRKFNDWLTVYGEVNGARTELSFNMNPAPGRIDVSAFALNNPFEQDISVAVPFYGVDGPAVFKSKTIGALGGAIVKLPFEWQAVLDYSWSRSTASFSLPAQFDADTQLGLMFGEPDVLLDVAKFPPTYGFLKSPLIESTPSRSDQRTVSLRLAGPLPIKLPGGRPTVTLLAERTKTNINDSITTLSSWLVSSVAYTPARDQATNSVYAEMRVPILSAQNNIPFARELEFQIAGRYDRTVGHGGLTSITCDLVFGDLPPPPYTCPAPGTVVERVRAANSTINPTISFRWQPVQDITFRGSFATAYLPLSLAQLVRTPGTIALNVRDPERGNALLGPTIQGITGGNPDLRPERSKTWTFGAILTPRFLPGFRFSADWTRIDKKDVFFSPLNVLLAGNTAEGQAQFEDFLRQYPDRISRGPASGGFAVGPITSIDASYINFNSARIDAWDFQASYTHDFGRAGNLSINASASHLQNLLVKVSESSTPQQFAGVLSAAFQDNTSSAGGLDWKGNASIVWSTDNWSIGWRSRYFSSFWLQASHAVVAAQGSAKIPSQSYHDLFGSVRVLKSTELRFGINNIFNKAPPTDVSNARFYSLLGDPRKANYYLSISQKF